MRLLKILIKSIVNNFQNHKIVIENYFFMTLLLFINSYFILLIYPFLIRTLGKEVYGFYIFVMSIVGFFIQIISYGFDTYGLKLLSINFDNDNIKFSIFSNIMYSRVILQVFSILLFSVLVLKVELLNSQKIVSFVIFGNTLATLFFPNWYFQAMQKMKIASYIQIASKLISLPFIFTFVKNPQDLVIFAIIITSSSLFSSVISLVYILKVDKIKFVNFSIIEIYKGFKEAFYFFCANLAGVAKVQIPNIIVGSRIGMVDLAIFDLAYKLISVTYGIFSNINKAFFPKIVKDFNKDSIKKIINFERILGVTAIFGVVLFGKFLIKLLGGSNMQEAYPLAIILSTLLYLYLQSGLYLDLVFVPNGKEKHLFFNQIYALCIAIFCLIVGLIIKNSVYVVAVSLVISAIFELLYLKFVSRKYKLLI